MFNKIIDACKYLLTSFPEAQTSKEYLDSRISASSQELFDFGFFPNLDNLPVLIDLVGEAELINSNLLYSKIIEDSGGIRSLNFCYFEHYPIIMPFKDPYGEIVGIVGRTLLSESEYKNLGIPKYKNTKNFKKGNFLFGLYENKEHIIKNNSVYLVEGQFDVIKAREKGFNNMVALGTSSMTDYQFSVLSRYTDNIFLLLDNDEAGEKGRKFITHKYGKYANIQNFYLPDQYKDVDDYFSLSQEDTLSFAVKV
jgi:DNA primase